MQPKVDSPTAYDSGTLTAEETHANGAEPSQLAVPRRRGRLRHRGDSVTARFALVFVGALLFGLFALLEPGIFPTIDNVQAMLDSQSIVLVLALAVIIPLRAGDFDLSIASVMVFSACLLAIISGTHGIPWEVGVIIVLLMGAAVGVVNSVFVVGFGINAFIVTLGIMTLIQGLTFGVTGGNLVTEVPSGLTSVVRASFLGLPLAVYLGWGLALALWYVYDHTPIGRHLLFVGGNQETARLAGVPVRRIRVGAFVASGVISALAGVMLVGKFGVADPSLGPGYLLAPYAAAFLGIAAVQLGRFNIGGTVIAVYLLIVATTGLLLLGTESWVTDVFNGAALVIAVAFARWVELRNARALKHRAT